MSVRPGVEIQTYRQAVGVYGLITPWNFPIAIPAWKSAPAMAFGNTVVIKPAGPTPATAEALVAILHEAGLPKGVLNMVIGDGGSARPSSTTRTSTASLHRLAGRRRRGRPGRDQAPGPRAAGDGRQEPADRARRRRSGPGGEIALDGSFFATGQRCTASSRLIVQDGIHDRFVAALARTVRRSRSAMRSTRHPDGPGGLRGPDGDLLPLHRRGPGRGRPDRHRRRAAEARQPRLVRPADPDRRHRLPAMRINTEEVFGPVASTIRVGSYEEALQIANGVEFGLSAGIATTSLKYARDFQRRARAGMVMVNLATAGVDYHVPFGGSKKSSYGPREQGFAAVEFFTQTKTAYSGA
jgi:acyl-CoA reductase-like NAD-dependent aldehyde dehydrogenase